MADAPRPGEGVDHFGGPVIDPTKNVLDLVAAAIVRQDDLRGENGKLFQSLLDGLKHYIDATVSGRVALTDARFQAVSKELEAGERRRIEHKADTQKAVDAAFSAAKEMLTAQTAASDKAISKSESTVSGQIKAVEGTVDDLKDRIGKLETQQQAKLDTRTDTRLNIGMVVGIAGFALAFVMGLVAILAALKATP